MPQLREIGEVETIRRLTEAREGAHEATGVTVGPGDDAAVLRPGATKDLVVTKDSFVEGRHYDPAIFTPAEIGARLAIANLSDIAAMGATPRWALISIGARPDHDADALVAMQQGASEALGADNAAIVGGNLVAVEGPEWLDLTLLGEIPRTRSWTRGGARPGDLIAITGSPGRAGAAVRLLAKSKNAADDAEWQVLFDAWRRPRSRIRVAQGLAQAEAVMGAIDLSDGFAGDLARVCEASQVGAAVEPANWPSDRVMERAAQTLGTDLESLWFGPSDDYELLLAVDPSRRGAAEDAARRAKVPLAIVGRFTDVSGIVTLAADGRTKKPITATGFDHFGQR